MTCPNNRCAKDNPDNAKYCNACGHLLSTKKGKRTRSNGMGTAYKRGRTWVASVVVGWHDNDGHPCPEWRRKCGFATKKEALEYCITLRGEKQRARLTIASQYETWISTKKFDSLSKSKQRAYRIAFDRLKPIHGMDIGDVRLEDIQPIIDGISTYYPARDVKQVLSHLFRPAVIDGRANHNYAEFIDMPQAPISDKDAFSDAEVERIWHEYENNTVAG